MFEIDFKLFSFFFFREFYRNNTSPGFVLIRMYGFSRVVFKESNFNGLCREANIATRRFCQGFKQIYVIHIFFIIFFVENSPASLKLRSALLFASQVFLGAALRSLGEAGWRRG
jgi:hypothetical protein